MALYWPDQKVALDIVDDPHRKPFEGDESYTVLRVTCADLCDYDSYLKVMRHLRELLGQEADTSHDVVGTAGDSLANVQIIASSEMEAEFMRAEAKASGRYVRGVDVWEGPIPPGSYEELSDTMRMSTPEYFFLRKANQLSFPEAVGMGIELCGKYRTVVTQYNRGDDYDFIRRPRTTKAELRRYLRGARGTKEGKRAKRVLRFVSEECCSPMGCHLFLLLCLPKAHGGYGLDRALLSGAFNLGDGFMPSSSGAYIAYDLCWPEKMVALQYTGGGEPSERQRDALNVHGMHTLCVTDQDVDDPERFDVVARELAHLLETSVPDRTDKWLEARSQLRTQVPTPTFPTMRLTMEDITEHLFE